MRNTALKLFQGEDIPWWRSPTAAPNILSTCCNRQDSPVSLAEFFPQMKSTPVNRILLPTSSPLNEWEPTRPAWLPHTAGTYSAHMPWVWRQYGFQDWKSVGPSPALHREQQCMHSLKSRTSFSSHLFGAPEL